MIHQLDAKSAFLNGELKEVYLVQPKGFLKYREEHLVCILKKALYGIKQAPRSWYDKIDLVFLQHSYKKSNNNPNLYTVFDKEGFFYYFFICR